MEQEKGKHKKNLLKKDSVKKRREESKFSKSQRAERSAGWIIWTVIIAIVLVTAILFVRQQFFGPTFEYKGYEVTRFNPKGTTETLYVLRAPIRIYTFTEIYHITLNNDPRKLEYIPVESTTRTVLLDPKPRQTWITFDPDMPNQGHVAIASTEIARVMGENGVFQLKLNGAVTKLREGLEDRHVTCDTSEERVVVIELRYGNETKIFVDETGWRCIIVQGKNEEELIRAADKTVLTLLGL